MGRVRLVSRRLRSYDGTELATFAAGKHGGETLVLCNGLGGSRVCWHPFIDHFGARMRVVGWDYRGLLGSGPAPERGAYSFEHHLRDLLHLLDHERVEAPILVGWSMGVQLGLELHRTHPDRLKALVAIHGTDGWPLRTAFDSSVADLLSSPVFLAMRMLGGRGRGWLPRLADSRRITDAFVAGAQRLGAMAPSLDRAAFQELARDWLTMDLGVYAEIFEHLCLHDASDLLPRIETPTLVIAGEIDRFTPAHLAQRMAKEMPAAELQLIPGATHFGLLERPDAILEAVEWFLRNRAGLA